MRFAWGRKVRNMVETSQEAKAFIKRIQTFEYRKDILLNSGVEFSGAGEQEALERYKAFLRALSYDVAKRIKEPEGIADL